MFEGQENKRCPAAFIFLRLNLQSVPLVRAPCNSGFLYGVECVNKGTKAASAVSEDNNQKQIRAIG